MSLPCVALGLLAGCSPPIQESRLSALDSLDTPLKKIAVLPIQQSPDAARPATRPDSDPPEQPSELLERALRVGLGRRSVVVVSPADVAAAAGVTLDQLASLDTEKALALAQEHRVADGIVTGGIERFSERRGSDLGVERPASVSFKIELWRANDTAPLWKAAFDETQEPVSENLLNLGRYPGHGTRWLTAEELLRWGADDAASRIPTKP